MFGNRLFENIELIWIILFLFERVYFTGGTIITKSGCDDRTTGKQRTTFKNCRGYLCVSFIKYLKLLQVL